MIRENLKSRLEHTFVYFLNCFQVSTVNVSSCCKYKKHLSLSLKPKTASAVYKNKLSPLKSLESD